MQQIALKELARLCEEGERERVCECAFSFACVCVNVRVRAGLCERVRGWLSARDGKKARERDEKMISE